MKPKVLFVCIENSCRSQMAEAFGKIHGAEKIDFYSSGSKPSGIVNPKAIATMKEVGYDLNKHHSIGLDQIPKGPYEYAITMGCGDECPFIEAKNRGDWQIPDPKHLPLEEFAKIRDQIEEKVKVLIQELT